MLVPGILGFQGLLLVFLPIFCFVIREKWRIAVARKEEIARLLVLASEETSMAEFKATVEYTSVTLAPRYQCAVCYCPTTTRCSQCKVVRYCSGKCQIVHWRRGHKDECRPTTSSVQYKEASDSTQKQPETSGNDLEVDEKGLFNSEDSSMMDNDKVEPPGVPSFSTPPSVGRGETLVGASTTSEIIGLSSFSDRAERTLSDSAIPRMHRMGASTNEIGQTILPSLESNNSVNRVINPGSNNFTMMTKQEVDSKLQVSKGKMVISDDVQPTKSGTKKPIREGILSGERATHSSKHRSSITLKSLRSDPAPDDREDDSQLQRQGVEHSLSSACGDHPSSDAGEHVASSYKPTLFDRVNVIPPKISNIPRFPQTTRNGLKSSVHKVVTQFRASKQAKPKIENVVTGRYSHKAIFSYELFVKLYSSDNVELCPFGLINCGNSCYANAVLQCLAFTRPLTSYLLQGFHSRACRKRGWCFICEFESLILKGREGKSPLSPIGILSKLQKIGSHLGQGKEEDAHEFLRYAVDTMQSICLKDAGALGQSAEETTVVGLTFGGYLQSKIKCLKCLGKSERYERMMDLTVEIDGEIGTLEEALSQFTATEILDGENKYHCSRCKSYVKAKKKLTILEAPNILTVVLKRFQSSNFEKLNKSVRYPEVLNMAPYMRGASDKSPVYSLYAVVVHLDVMNSAFSGHYVCYVKNLQGGWFKIDDSTVVPVNLERVLLEGAYMLLYARHSPRAPSLAGNNLVSHSGKFKKRNFEAVPLKTRLNSLVSDRETPAAQRKLYINQFSDLDDWRSHSSSETSSLFSSSDASSCSTTSTKDSISAEDFSDYIFGEFGGPNWYRHYELSSKSDGYSAL